MTETNVATRATAAFTAEYGEDPQGLWAAPGRLNLIGEHTDYNDGYVLPFALPERVVAAVGPNPGDGWTVSSDFADEPVSFTAPEPGSVPGWAGYVAGVVWALRESGSPVEPARLAIASDIPLGAGLSSSAAIECAVMGTLCDLSRLSIPDQLRVRLAQRAENDFVGAPTGIMDQSASVLCRAGHALFLDCRTLEVEHIPFDVAAAGLAVLVINTNAPHRHVDGEYANRRAACEAAARALGVPALRDAGLADLPRLDDPVLLRRARHIVTENQRVLDTVGVLRSGDIRGIGPLMTASHESLRDDFEVTVPELDTAVDAALAAGAYGARMTGGGFGGCALALIDASRASSVSAAVAAAFAQNGFTAPESFVVTPSAGAHRV
jgi:galactokinase